jgi:predicted nuclease with TOPRIM domain
MIAKSGKNDLQQNFKLRTMEVDSTVADSNQERKEPIQANESVQESVGYLVQLTESLCNRVDSLESQNQNLQQRLNHVERENHTLSQLAQRTQTDLSVLMDVRTQLSFVLFFFFFFARKN